MSDEKRKPKLTLEQRFRKQSELIATEFLKEYLKKNKYEQGIRICEAPAAEAWVVLINDECWVAHCDDGFDDPDENFVFWGPLGKPYIHFPCPDGWPT